ncbi:60S ribosomal protein L18a-like protein isoform X2 [Coffea eugenioides]|uniref:Large ribosomal subunit protein eL20z-like isoform X4 n=1 Tax=Coffea arabica TaxID=13443 RepID=A0A6P6XET9_COFAR|nr:60S ribosomal protein L18a-like protein isoform X3 [Coffea arabica]XP_027169820.1 60S ribosomal protein L18a-like protein isoform X2 [Coffea eugenioides]
MDQKLLEDAKQHQNGDYALTGDIEHAQLGMFDKPLPCFGCGVGWFSLLLGFFCPLFWYYATILYFGNYYHKDPRERAGLAANAIAALIFTVVVLIVVAIILF